MKLPKIDRNVAHPQSVWFQEHWYPIFVKLETEVEQLKEEKLQVARSGKVLLDAKDVKIAELSKIILDASNYSKSWGKHGMDMFAFSKLRAKADEIEKDGL